MKKVIVASKNPVKIQAVKNGFEKMFPDREFEFVGISVPSNVAEQPTSNTETFLGAQNRADNSSAEVVGADFYIGIESGIEHFGLEVESFTWVVTKSAGRYGKAKTGTFFLPKQVVELVKAGKELSEADDAVFKHTNSKHGGGAVGILTGDVIDREKYLTEAVILSLIPFKNVDLY